MLQMGEQRRYIDEITYFCRLNQQVSACLFIKQFSEQLERKKEDEEE
jgi:hypothetical protein